MFGFTRTGGPRVERIAPKEAVARAAAGEVVVLDVREAPELAQTGIAEGAVHVPLAEVAQRCDPAHGQVPGLSKDRPVVIYCAAGGRAGRAGEALIAMGYTEVYNLGGISDWQAGGGKVTR